MRKNAGAGLNSSESMPIIPRAKRTAQLEKKLKGLASLVDGELLGRLRPQHGTIGVFLDEADIKKALEPTDAASELFILSKVDKYGNLGRAARRELMLRKNAGLGHENAGLQAIKRAAPEIDDPVEVLLNSTDQERRALACKKFVSQIAAEAGFVPGKAQVEVPSLLAELPPTMDTHLVQRFPGKPLSRKFELLDYVKDCQKEIIASRASNRVQYNYNKIAEDFVKKYNVARREKETAIELLELHDPPEKRALPVGGRQKNKRTNASPKDSKTNAGLVLGKSTSTASFRIKSVSDMKTDISDPVTRARKKVPGAEAFWRNYQSNPKRFAELFEHVNQLSTTISNAKQDLGLNDKTLEGIVLSKLRKDEQQLVCEFGTTSLVLKNLQPKEGVLVHGLYSIPSACQQITSVKISNAELSGPMLHWILKILLESKAPIQSLTIAHQEVTEETCGYISELLAKSGTLTHLALNNTGLNTKGLARLLMGALQEYYYVCGLGFGV